LIAGQRSSIGFTFVPLFVPTNFNLCIDKKKGLSMLIVRAEAPKVGSLGMIPEPARVRLKALHAKSLVFSLLGYSLFLSCCQQLRPNQQ
jgi:hypothetical protein